MMQLDHIYWGQNIKPQVEKPTINQVYTPPSNSTKEGMEEFCTSLQNTIQSLTNQDMTIVKGDFNTKIGKAWKT